MASVKSALVLVVLLALGVELSLGQDCSQRLDGCYTTYTRVQTTSECGAIITLNACITEEINDGICSQAEVSAHANIQAAYRQHPGCGGSLPKASLIGIVLTAVVGLLFRA